MNKLNINKWLASFLMLFSAIALSTVMLQAQDVDTGLKANIPFAFTAGNTKLPAGQYEIVPVETVEPTLELRDASNETRVLLVVETTQSVMEPKTSEVVFDSIGGREFLREVRTDEYHYRLVESNQEKEMEMQGKKSESHSIPCSHMKEASVKTSEAASR
jgi:hypothetical protein